MEFTDVIDLIEQKLHLKKDFCSDIFFESNDDWTYIIRLHALVEASVSHLITERINEIALREIFTRLELGNEVTGKIAFGKLLGVLDNNDRNYIRVLSELRNKLVHNIQEIQFTLIDYYNQLDKNQFKSLSEKLLHGKDVVNHIKSKGYNIQNYFMEDPRHPWFMGAWLLIYGVILNLENESDISTKKNQQAINTFGSALSEYPT